MHIEDVLLKKGREVSTAQATDTVASAIALLAAKRIGAVVVLDPTGKLAGIFSERDLVGALAKEGAAALNHKLGDLMSTHLKTCHPTDRIDEALARMTLHRIRHLPVTDNGQLAGMISIGDLVQHRLVEKEMEANVLLDISRMRA